MSFCNQDVDIIAVFIFFCFVFSSKATHFHLDASPRFLTSRFQNKKADGMWYHPMPSYVECKKVKTKSEDLS